MLQNAFITNIKFAENMNDVATEGAHFGPW